MSTAQARVHAFGKTVGMSAAAAIGESRLMLLDAGLRIVRVLVLLAIWQTLVQPGEVVNGFTLAGLLTYTLIAEIFAQQLLTKSELDSWLWEGVIASRLLYPMALVNQLVAQLLGSWVFGFVTVSLPILVVAPLVGIDISPDSWQAGLWFVPSLLLSITIGLALDMILCAMTVAFSFSIWLVDMMRVAVLALLSGSVLPLAILPWGLGKVFDWLPFASMASAPLRIYTGTGSPLPLLALQLGWAVVLWLFAGYLWRASRERLVGYGG